MNEHLAASPPSQSRRPWAEHAATLAVYLRPQRVRVAGLAALLLGSIGLQLFNPQVMRHFVDSATRGAADRTLFLAAVLFLAVAVLQQLAAVAATYLGENIGWTATNALRSNLLRHCLGLDPSFYKARTPGELIERIDGDATALATFFSRWVIQVVGNVLLLLGVLVLLWLIDWRVGLLLSGCVGVVGLVLGRVQSRAAPQWRIARQRSAELYGFIEERLAGVEEIRSCGAEAHTLNRLYERLGRQFRDERRARVTGQFTWTSADLLFVVATGLLFLLAAGLYRAEQLTLGTILSIVFYIELLSRPLNQIARQAEEFQKASAGLARVQELLQTSSALAPGGDAPLPAGALPVAFHHVGFGYEAEGEPLFDDLSLRLDAGRVLGLLGRTGSGKTTLARLLFRLHDPRGGRIELGGVDLRAVSLPELRRRVGVVTQEVQLFHATIRDNLTLFDATIADARIVDAIEALGLGPWYEALPSGLDTVLASGGGLSAGEAQLLAFTRIFLRDPGLVILDEASSRLDPATEQLIERAVTRLLRGRTAILIAHRLHTVHRADEILILEQGRVVERGERARLIDDADSRFSRLLRTGIEEALA